QRAQLSPALRSATTLRRVDRHRRTHHRLKRLERHGCPGNPPARLARARPPPGDRRRLAGALHSYQEPRQPLDAEALEPADQEPGNLHLAQGEDLSDLLGAQAARLQPVLDPARQARLGQTLLGIRKAQVREDVAAASGDHALFLASLHDTYLARTGRRGPSVALVVAQLSDELAGAFGHGRHAGAQARAVR